MRQCSSVVNFIIKNHLIRSSLTSKNTKKYLFSYKDEFNGCEVSCVLIKLWLCLNCIRLQLVVNNRVHEKKIEYLTLLSCNNNVNTFLTNTEKIRIVNNLMIPDKQEFSDHRFVRIIFDQSLN